VTGNGTISTGNPAALYGDRAVQTWVFNNDGKLHAGRYGIDTYKGGDVSNGESGHSRASISGARAGILIGRGTGTVVNGGTVSCSSGAGYGVRLRLGGSVTNGAGSRAALISGGRDGVLIDTQTGTLVNYAAVRASAPDGIGALLAKGGDVTNGGDGNTAATITGVAVGVSIRGAGDVANMGTITAASGIGVYRVGTGSLVNGSTAATRAEISGKTDGVLLKVSGADAVNAVMNFGVITGGTTGVELDGGGSVTNGSVDDIHARMTGGDYGVSINNAGTVTNYGTIDGTKAVKPGTVFPHPSPIPKHLAYGGYGVVLQTGGVLVNGGSGDTHASISGAFIGVKLHGADSDVHNYGTISGGVVGVYNYLAGTLVNGSATDTQALISGGQLGFRNTYPGAMVENFGTFTSANGVAVNIASGGHPGSAGQLVNGTASDSQALLSGRTYGVDTVGGAVVDNYATILGATMIGAYVTAGGTLVNGSATDTAALIAGYTVGAAIKGSFDPGHGASVNSLLNDGTITGRVTGAALFTGGVLLNGAAGVGTALIEGGRGAGVQVGDSGTVLNDATISSAAGAGIYATLGGVFSNAQAATIAGSTYGIDAQGAAPATVGNSGTISATRGIGVLLNNGAALTNGSAGATGAVIRGTSVGVELDGPDNVDRLVINYGTISGAIGIYCSPQARATVVNAGTIIGTGGTALQFGVGADTLVVDPGAVFVGAVDGGIVGSNTIELAAGNAGSGSFGGVGDRFTNFATLSVENTANWTLTGGNDIAALVDDGTLQIGADSSLQVLGAVAGQSTGSIQIGGNATLEVAAMTGSSASIQFLNGANATLAIDRALAFGVAGGGTTYSGPLLRNFHAGDAIDMKDVLFAGAGLSFSASTGLLQVSDAALRIVGTLRFATATLGSGEFHAGDDGHGFLLLTHG
jgi:hypothetical protein